MLYKNVSIKLVECGWHGSDVLHVSVLFILPPIVQTQTCKCICAKVASCWFGTLLKVWGELAPLHLSVHTPYQCPCWTELLSCPKFAHRCEKDWFQPGDPGYRRWMDGWMKIKSGSLTAKLSHRMQHLSIFEFSLLQQWLGKGVLF